MRLFGRIVLTLSLSGFVFLSADAASAESVTFSCAAEVQSDCNGATYGLSLSLLEDLGGGNYLYQLIYGIDTTGYTGNSTDYVRAVSFKNVVDNMSNLEITDAPFGETNWTVEEVGLNGKDCKAENGEEAACAEALATLNGGFGAPVNPVGPLTSTQYYWTFTFESTDSTPNATGDIKYQYVANTLNSKGEFVKVGSLGSFATPLSVPEPGSLFLFSSGLLALAARKRIFA